MTKEQELQKELKRFAYAVSHDLQSPLRLVTSYLQLIQRQIPADDARLQDFVQEALTGSKDMASYIEDLLQYSRIINSDYQADTVDITKLISLDIMKRQAAGEDFEVTFDDNQTFHVLGVKEHVKKLIQHLIDNAIKFKNRDQKLALTIDIQPKGATLQVGISDNGIGISPDNVTRIFELYRQLHPKSEYKGNGMGLAICQKIIQLHQGEIWVNSVPQEGTTMFFTLPLANT